MTNCPKFVEMQKIFQEKITSSLEGKVVAKVKTIIVDVNVVDINVVTKTKS
jgi:hypothetical protein